MATDREPGPDLARVLGPVDAWCHTHAWPRPAAVDLQQVWLPLAQWIRQVQAALGRPVVIGLVGLQGSGKSTLAQVLRLILQTLDCPTICLSLDDLYLNYAERLALLSHDPRLIWRGPPGTHDVGLGCQVLDALRQGGRPVAVPRFEKALHGGQGDRRGFETVPAAQVILFEGWFVGLYPRDLTQLTAWPAELATPAGRQFALDCNQRLTRYTPLWERLDRLLVLDVEDTTCSRTWRGQAEPPGGMTPTQVAAFVTYFWQALHPDLFHRPVAVRGPADWVVPVEPDHSYGQLYQPALSFQSAKASGPDPN